ncbi:MAG: sugar ABC transporter ATP-binding protein [Sulfobacillus thermosulfidooxidans]|nr:MAG: sugar ABC transporter ATP-binding protein [Sulfobacillus thermosulfidooxidans]
MNPLLNVSQLTVRYRGSNGPITAVQDVSFSVYPNEIVGFVGESGSGKSTVAQAILRLHPSESVEVTGDVRFQDTNLLTVKAEALRQRRWTQIAMVSQSSMNALNPLRTIEQHFNDVWIAHPSQSPRDRHTRNVELLAMVNLDALVLQKYPHQLSGGMRQRIAIALAMMFHPPFMIMDEPTTALDVLVERDILARIQALQQDNHLSILFITHDLHVIFKLAHRLLIMYAGEIVESGPVADIQRCAYHPYSQGLRRSFLSIDMPRVRRQGIPGWSPDSKQQHSGCRFAPRCAYAQDQCLTVAPSFEWIDDAQTHGVRCHYWREIVPLILWSCVW